METHSFGVRLATKYGMVEAVLLGYFYYWVRRNEAKQDADKFHEGRYWVYDSTRELANKFPYLDRGKIIRSIKHLVDEGLLLKGNFNKIDWDRTVWYSLSDNAIALFSDEGVVQNEPGVVQNEPGVVQNEPTIPIQSTYSIPYSYIDDDDIKQTQKKKKVNQKNKTKISDTVYAKAIDDWENYIGIPLTKGLAEQIISLVDEVGGEIFLEALKIASANSVRKLKYVESVAVNLKRGEKDGTNGRSYKQAEKSTRMESIKSDKIPVLGDYI